MTGPEEEKLLGRFEMFSCFPLRVRSILYINGNTFAGFGYYFSLNTLVPSYEDVNNNIFCQRWQ
jgi:hypothetical protein